MSLQRRRGQTVLIWKTQTVDDRRGNHVTMPDPTGPYEVKVAVIPQRGQEAEVPGQQVINVVRLIAPPDLDGVEAWSYVEYAGSVWDVVAPPVRHYGSRQTRHWSIDIRERP